MAGWWSSKPFDEQIARATAESLPTGTEDMFLSLEIADQIRSKSVAPKEAMRALKRRINHKNPNVQLAALKLTDTCVKNGGDHFLIEVASREFMDNLVSLLKSPSGVNIDVKNKTLEEIQTWALAFEGRPHLSYVKTTYNKLKADGLQFPEAAAVTASFVDSAAPPEWADSDRCMRCHTPFTLTNRKHHCRNCGNVFCGDCSSKSMPLPHLGIVQPVRVCETCHEELNLAKNAKVSTVASPSSSAVPAQGNRSMQPRSARIEDDDDKDLKMALQMSLEEAKRSTAQPASTISQPKPNTTTQSIIQDRTDDTEDEDLKAAIAASLRDAEASKAMQYPTLQTYSQPQSTQPPPQQQPQMQPQTQQPLGQYQAPASELSILEAENITLFATLIERMQSSPPGAILREPRIQELYEAVSALKPKLGRTLSTVVGTYESLVDMHAKLNTVVRYYDKMLEDRLATAYSHATYQEARPPAQSPHAYQYNPPPQSPSSPSHQRLDYFPSRRSTSISDPANSQAPLQAPQASPLTNSIPQNPHGSAPPQSWGYGNYPTPSLSPSAAKNPPSQYYQEPVPYQNETINVPPSHQPVDQQYPQQHRPGYDAQASYPPYADNHGYYQGQSLPKREETSLIDL